MTGKGLGSREQRMRGCEELGGGEKPSFTGSMDDNDAANTAGLLAPMTREKSSVQAMFLSRGTQPKF